MGLGAHVEPVSTTATLSGMSMGACRDEGDAISASSDTDVAAPGARPSAMAASDESSERPPHHGHLLPFLGGVLLGLPVLLVAYPPMTDFPFHEVAVALLRHRGDPSWDVPGVYASNWLHPNQLFYILAYGLSLAMPVLWACKAVVFASLAALPVAMDRLRRFLEAPPPLTIAACLFGYGYFFYWGFAPNLLALPALLFAIPSLLRHGIAPSMRSLTACLLWLAVLYFGHEAMFAAGLVVLASAWLVSVPLLQDVVLKLAPAVLATGVVLAKHLFSARRTLGTVAGSPTMFASPFERLSEMPTVIAGPHDGWSALGLVILLLATYSALGLAPRALDAIGNRRRLACWVASLGLLGAYFLFPTGIWGTNLLHQRFLPPAFLLFSVAATSGVKAPPRVAQLLAWSALGASLLLAVPEFLLAQDSFEALSRLAPLVQRNSAMLSLGFVNTSAHASHAYGQYCHLVVEGGGRAAYDISSSPISPMVRTNDHAWELPFRLSTAPDTFAVDTVFRIYRYLFAWADDPRVEEVLTEALQPEARLLGREGNWLLYESTLPVLPLPTPDSLLPSPHGPHLDQRLRAVIAKLPHETRWPVARRLGLETIDATEPTKL